jgi:hypothetical protein
MGVARKASGQQRNSDSKLREALLSEYALTSCDVLGAEVTKPTRSFWRASNKAKVRPTMPSPRIQTSSF